MISMLFAMLLSPGAQAAQMGDMPSTIITCHPVIARPDYGMKVEVQDGGFVGTQVVITQMVMGHSRVDHYVVHKKPAVPGRVGAPEVFVGRKIELSMNFTTAPMKDGGQIGHLTLNGKPQPDLSCVRN